MTNTISKLETIYPSTDGQPMAESTEHYQWIVTITGGLESLFKDDENVFVAGDLLWYPVENRPEIRRAPDVMVVFGRPKGARGSYIQHLESGIAPQVVFEILSRGNRILEMSRKFDFYQTYGVEEYYVYDHLSNDLAIWIRNQEQNRLEPIDHVQNWISPRLGIRFELTDESLNIFNPDGNKFLTYLEQVQQKEQALSAMSKYASKLREMGIDPENLL
ncbi:MAG: Uma2 family endonuclease [Pseudanabaena sp.]|jgi:Uma2 family endonuclease|nr:Uma2 family endonuclease [Pseudanabaena sp. M090S1SP2A07QC]MCA6507935.1 Uma2 family endonuclease [Pseudanabaena sp. M172S2SP2A07QC]MCA6528164.1 Uma2 family endonuclease [Pseudanabaena sp. M179S2SP2A07QC]MCA6530729.1 Uma2 family endonuclease [Pseudanabaena sp. M125S2SP2A07QC]MCA6535909.1 Uma2 family endonuclease [Pseudanabaena sp. M176S2SP2A07QC]MCA6540321.1 Uma2 family endonuclease [Pseudanabaena sp. M037S2SP2A07QC]MCA6541855.1 Uma2 family endonuclease [Pseudanabaena sp. M074S1SP2A07QC]MC